VRRGDARVLYCLVDGSISCACFSKNNATIPMRLSAKRIGYGLGSKIMTLNGTHIVGNISYDVLIRRRQSEEFVVKAGYFCFAMINYDWYLRLRDVDTTVVMKCAPCPFCR
jgi:hypothetical protein